MNGRLVSHYEEETVDGYSTIYLDVSALAAGTYIVQIGEDAKHVSNAIQRLIVLR